MLKGLAKAATFPCDSRIALLSTYESLYVAKNDFLYRNSLQIYERTESHITMRSGMWGLSRAYGILISPQMLNALRSQFATFIEKLFYFPQTGLKPPASSRSALA